MERARRNVLPQFLLALECRVDLLKHAFNIGQLRLSFGHLNLQSLQLENSDITLDDLALKIFFVFYHQSVLGTEHLNLRRRLHRIILKIAMRAFEGLEDDVPEVRNAEKEESSSSLHNLVSITKREEGGEMSHTLS